MPVRSSRRRTGLWNAARPVWHAAAALLAAVPLSLRADDADLPRQAIRIVDLERHVAFLASDTLEGREAGTQGGRAAAAYLETEFSRIRLAPAGDDKHFGQEFGHGYRNLLGAVEGSDETLRDEWILFGAHFDHVGFGNSSNSHGPYGYIHNGADDNASGVATLLEVAEAIAALDSRPRRSLLFVLWDAEEKGLLGSRHWIHSPTRPLDRVRLAINVDMVGRMAGERVVVFGERTAAGLRMAAARANQRARLQCDFSWEQRSDSDHFPFYTHRVPYLALWTGNHVDYHRPSDDVDKLNVPGMQRVAQVLFDLLVDLGNRDELPGFRIESAVEDRSLQRQLERSRVAQPIRLGITWNRDRQPRQPATIVAVEPGSPAALAGFAAGDRLLEFDDRPLTDVDDLRRLVATCPQQTSAVVERTAEEERQRLDVRLAGPAVPVGMEYRTDPAEPEAIIVTWVREGSMAAAAGLRPGDRLLTADQNQPPGEPLPRSGTNGGETIVDVTSEFANADSAAGNSGGEPARWTVEREGRFYSVGENVPGIPQSVEAEPPPPQQTDTGSQ